MKRCRTIICIPEADDTLIVRNPGCLNAQNHTPAPPGYIAWHAWAERMGKTHNQVRCLFCNRYEIWVPKPPLQPSHRRAIGRR